MLSVACYVMVTLSYVSEIIEIKRFKVTTFKKIVVVIYRISSVIG